MDDIDKMFIVPMPKKGDTRKIPGFPCGGIVKRARKKKNGVMNKVIAADCALAKGRKKK